MQCSHTLRHKETANYVCIGTTIATLSPSKARVQQLKYQLHTVKMGTSSMSEYIQSVKSIVDNLAEVAIPVADSDLVSTLLSGLSLPPSTHESTLYCQKNSSVSCLVKRFTVGVLSLHQTPQLSLPFSCGSYCFPHSKLPFSSIFFPWSRTWLRQGARS